MDARSSFVRVKSSLKILFKPTYYDCPSLQISHLWGLRNKMKAIMAQSDMVASLPICIILNRFFKMQVIFVSLKKLPNSEPIFCFDLSFSLCISFIVFGCSQSFRSVSRWLEAFSGMTNVSNKKTEGSNNAGLSLSASSRAFVCRITALLGVP